MKYKSKRPQPELNTSSLPDIVFMILFFFMAVGMFPSPQAKVENDILIYESGLELDETSAYIHVRIGPDGIQLGYDLTSIETLKEDLIAFKKEFPRRSIVVLHIDNDVEIGLLKNEVEPAILDAGIKNIRYETAKEN